jgi:uncharacterized RDD family membrane protein YckC
MEQTFNKSITAYAGFWIRTGAYIIDLVIAGAITTILSRIFFGSYFAYENTDPGPGAISLLVNWLYFSLQESSERQATIGKLAAGIRVCNENGERLTFAHATGRFFAKIISAIILFMGFIMVAFNEKRQGLHDKIAGTYVVKS